MIDRNQNQMILNELPPPDTKRWVVRRKAAVTGRRYGAPEAVEAGFVDQAVPLDQLMAAATELGRPHTATAGPVLGRIKRQLFADVVDAVGI